MEITELLTTVIHRLTNFIFSLQLWDVLDILVIAYLIYRLLLLVRKTNTSRLLKGVLVVIVLMWLSAERMLALSFVLERIVEWGVLALIILFQPEIRRGLEQLGSSQIPFLQIFAKPQVDRQTVEDAIAQTGLR